MRYPDTLFSFLYGIDEARFPRCIIISPFLPVKTMAQQFGGGCAFKGNLFEGCIGDGLAYVRTGIGASLVRDALLAFQDRKRAVIFIGSAGGLGSLKIGDIFIAGEARDWRGRYSPDAALKELFQSIAADTPVSTGAVYSLEAVLDGEEVFLKAREEEGVSACELEVAVFYRTASERGLAALALLYITDLPLERRFWEERTEVEAASIAGAKKKLFSIIQKTCMRFSEEH